MKRKYLFLVALLMGTAMVSCANNAEENETESVSQEEPKVEEIATVETVTDEVDDAVEEAYRQVNDMQEEVIEEASRIQQEAIEEASRMQQEAMEEAVKMQQEAMKSFSIY